MKTVLTIAGGVLLALVLLPFLGPLAVVAAVGLVAVCFVTQMLELAKDLSGAAGTRSQQQAAQKKVEVFASIPSGAHIMDCIDAAWLLFVPPEGWGKKRNSFLARQKQSIANPERWRKGDESLLSGEFWFLSRTDPSGGEERTRAVLALWQEIDRCCKELCSMNKNFVTSQSQVEASFENLRQAKFYEDCCQEVQDALALAEQVKSEKKKK
ncbi:hypothetical protein [uncultured Oscillibacter sp.]|uniref:hypothetical protein n=1 Tax=uncultured Oscillibacter sp. TaxID=876091 RepID=UPI002624B16D|nr:hypothetical protein [uncultured Oscillibacter sp.]